MVKIMFLDWDIDERKCLQWHYFYFNKIKEICAVCNSLKLISNKTVSKVALLIPGPLTKAIENKLKRLDGILGYLQTSPSSRISWIFVDTF